MSLVTVSTKTKRVYQRRFDHEEAIARHAAGETVAALAREYGVADGAVKRVVDPATRARMNSYSRAWIMSGVCVDCGKDGVARHHRSPVGPRCQDCATKDAATSVRLDELRCITCRQWLPDEEFPRSKRQKARRGRHRACRACNVKARTAYRLANRVECEGGCGTLVEGVGRSSRGGVDRPYLCRDCWQLHQGRIPMATGNAFVVLVETGEDVWEVIAKVNANNRRDALNAAFANGRKPSSSDRIVIVSGVAWKPGRPKIVETFDLDVGDE